MRGYGVWPWLCIPLPPLHRTNPQICFVYNCPFFIASHLMYMSSFRPSHTDIALIPHRTEAKGRGKKEKSYTNKLIGRRENGCYNSYYVTLHFVGCYLVGWSVGRFMVRCIRRICVHILKYSILYKTRYYTTVLGVIKDP